MSVIPKMADPFPSFHRVAGALTAQGGSGDKSTEAVLNLLILMHFIKTSIYYKDLPK